MGKHQFTENKLQNLESIAITLLFVVLIDIVFVLVTENGLFVFSTAEGEAIVIEAIVIDEALIFVGVLITCVVA